VIRVVIADDHALVRAGLRQLVAEESSISVVGEAEDGDGLLALLRTESADVAVIDIGMPGPGLLGLLERLRTEHPTVRPLVLSVYPEGQLAVRALAAGAAGYVSKTRSAADLIFAIQKVHSGEIFLSRRLAEQLVDALARGDTAPKELSAREREVLDLLAAGRSNKEIAAQVGVSTKTISTYRRRILDKLHLRSNADLVRYVLERGLPPVGGVPAL